MTTENLENKQETNLEQTKVDTNLNQPEPVIETKTQEETESVDPNWRAFREARKKDRAEKEAAQRRAAEKEAEAAALKAAMEAVMKTPSNQQNYFNEQPDESEDERIAKLVDQRIAEREARYRREAEERERLEAPQRLAKMFPDFNQIMTQENCDYIDYHYPELTAPFQHMPEGVEKWTAMYNVVKKLVPNAAYAKKEAARIDNNLAKPKSISTASLTQNNSAPGNNILSEERKAANWARMQRTLSGIG